MMNFRRETSFDVMTHRTVAQRKRDPGSWGLSRPSSVKRTLHLLKTPDILLANDNRLCVSSLSVNSIEPAEACCPWRKISRVLGRAQIAAFR